MMQNKSSSRVDIRLSRVYKYMHTAAHNIVPRSRQLIGALCTYLGWGYEEKLIAT